MDDNVIESHIELFVNDFSLDLGVEGERAIEAVEFEIEGTALRGRRQVLPAELSPLRLWVNNALILRGIMLCQINLNNIIPQNISNIRV